MEYNIGLLITGLFILLVTLYRVRNFRTHRGLQHQLEQKYDVSNLDTSGNTRYVSCFSHKWVMENITKSTHSRFGAMLQDHLANNTLLAGIWIGLIVGTSSMLLTMLLVESLRSIGTVIVIFVFGVMISVGPGGPRYSENLLDAVLDNEIADLNSQDYVYVKIANDTIKRAVVINVVLATLFIVLVPWGHLLPSVIAGGIALFTVNILWDPATLLLDLNVGAAILYIAFVIGFLSFICFKVGQRVISPEEETEPRVQW